MSIDRPYFCFPTPEISELRLSGTEISYSGKTLLDLKAIGATELNELQGMARGDMKDDVLEAFGKVAPILLCGEESASHIFKSMSDIADLKAAALLKGIAADELLHGYLLTEVFRSVPNTADPMTRKKARLFFLRLHTDTMTQHLARLVALDSMVTRLLANMSSKHAGLSGRLKLVAGHIREDEGRHVRICREYFVALGGTKDQLAEENDLVRTRLSELLNIEHHAFERMGCDLAMVLKTNDAPAMRHQAMEITA